MRADYSLVEGDPALWEAFWSGDYLPMIIHFPIISDPGSQFQYGNLTYEWLGMIVSRACDTELRTFTEAHLLSPIGAKVGEWTQNADGYYIGYGEIHSTPRDAAKFGLLYLNGGTNEGKQIISVDWIHDSLQIYSENAGRSGLDRIVFQREFIANPLEEFFGV